MLRQESPDRRADVMFRKLLHALECARSQLAVAMAAESKATPRARWRNYVEIEDRTRRCLKRLRTVRRSLPLELPGWLPTLEALQRASRFSNVGVQRAGAEHLCRCLGDVLARLEAQEQPLGDINRPSK